MHWFAAPSLPPDLHARIEALHAARQRLGREVSLPRPWMGALRRQARADTARSSVAIEGFHVAPTDAWAIVGGAPTDDSDEQRAFAAYAHAMHHVAVLADDPQFDWTERVVLDLHFDLCAWAPAARPGRLRDGAMRVTGPGGRTAYVAPEADALPGLLRAWIADLAAPSDVPTVVRAALAHLNLVSLHPFADGNGRISRVVQSLVLARDGAVCPELGSIEPALHADTPGYYAALQQAQGGSWPPARDATPWVAYCVEAHLAQAQRRLDQIDAAAARWGALEALVAAQGWPDRLVIALESSLHRAVDRAAYAAEAGVSTATATADLRRLVDAGWLARSGATKVTRYAASAALRGRVGAEPAP